MVEQEDILFRPVLHGMITADRLLDGTIDLNFIMMMNEAMLIEEENKYRAVRAARE